MTNKLPEKLTSLRKNFGIAQGEAATKLHIPVAVYMNWENGNSIPNMEQLKLISGLYHVPLQDLVDNTREIVLPAPVNDQDSIEIPFMSDTTGNSYAQAPQETIQVPVEEEQPEDAGDTRIMTTDQLQATKVNEIIDDDEEEPEEEEEDYDDEDEDEDEDEPLGLGDMFAKLFHKNKKQDDEEERPAKHSSGKKEAKDNKTKILIIAVAAAAVLLVVLLARLLGGGSSGGYSVSLSDVNRLALGDSFSMYLKGEGQLTTMGNAPSLSADDLVQVSAGGSIAMGLKKDGTVVCTGSGSACNVDNWSEIKMIAAGTNHTVGLKDDGTVLCNGSSGACNVSDWTDIDAVYAGNEITIGKKKDGTLLVSGNVSAEDRLTALKNVSSVSIGGNQVAVVNSDGTVACYAIGTDATSSTATWTNIEQAAAGGNFAAGLSGGKVMVATTDPDLAQASTWTNVKYIAARGNTLIGAASDGSIIGVGDNSNNVYGSSANSSASADASASAETTETPSSDNNNQNTSGKLASPTSLKASANGKNVEVSWNAVTGANYYQVSINSNPVQTIKANENHASFDASKLQSGQNYTITVTAYSGNNSSNAATVQLAYQGTMGAPTNVTATSGANGTSANVSWSQVTGAEWYRVFLNGQVYGNDTSLTSMAISGLTAGTEYTITVEAGSGYWDNGKYKENMSQPSAAVKITPADTGSYTVTFNLSNNTSAKASLKSGTYKVSDYITAPSGYHLKDTSQTFTVNGQDATVTVQLDQDAVSVTGFTFTLDKTSIKVGETAKATAKIDPDNATDKTITWSSDNTGIATVGSDGTVTGVAVGQTTIKGVTKDGSKTYSATITVTADSSTDSSNNG